LSDELSNGILRVLSAVEMWDKRKKQEGKGKRDSDMLISCTATIYQGQDKGTSFGLTSCQYIMDLSILKRAIQ
jgi:hypothetical protein